MQPRLIAPVPPGRNKVRITHSQTRLARPAHTGATRAKPQKCFCFCMKARLRRDRHLQRSNGLARLVRPDRDVTSRRLQRRLQCVHRRQRKDHATGQRHANGIQMQTGAPPPKQDRNLLKNNFKKMIFFAAEGGGNHPLERTARQKGQSLPPSASAARTLSPSFTPRRYEEVRDRNGAALLP